MRKNWLGRGSSWLLGYREVPFAVRGLVRRELQHMMFWGVVWGALNGNYCGFIAARGLGAPDVLVGLVVSSIAIANLFAIWWASLAARRPIRRVLMPGILCLAAVLFSFAATPLVNLPDTAIAGAGRERSATWSLACVVFAVQVMICWILIQGVNTVRTRLWRLNYPDSHRGRIMARFAIWQISLAVLTSAVMGSYLDGHVRIRLGPGIDQSWSLTWLPGAGDPDAYCVLFPMAGLSALISAWFYRRAAVRREQHALAEFARSQAAPMPHDTEASFNLPGWFQTLRAGVVVGLGEARSLLRRDRRFRRYMAWQMVAGTGTMIMDVPLILILNERFRVNYVAAAGLLAIAPQLVLILCTPMWARLFDRWSLMRFRVFHMSVWVASRVVLGIGIWARSLPLVGLALGLAGVGLGGGKFSWQLGHMAFSQRHNDAIYMGIHQALTGIRGLITPFVGALLYRSVLDWHVVWLAVALQGVSIYGFARLGRTGDKSASTTQQA